jgi:hypothetical protein
MGLLSGLRQSIFLYCYVLALKGYGLKPPSFLAALQHA